MDLIYYYNDSCGCCKGYEDVVDKLSTELKIMAQKRNTDETEITHDISGIPTLILEDNGTEIFRNVGNLPYKIIYEMIKGYVK